MQQTVSEYFPNVSLRVAFKAPATLESHFPYKDKVTDPNKLSMVVYKLKCLTEGCDASYIGESKRICNIRMEDHIRFQYSLFKPIIRPSVPSIRF